MPAHMLDTRHTCPKCGARADWLVRNSFNAEQGHYCKRHAQQAMDDLNRWERER